MGNEHLTQRFEALFAALRDLRASEGRWPGIWLAVEVESITELLESYPDDDRAELEEYLDEEFPETVKWFRVDATQDEREQTVSLYPTGVVLLRRRGEESVTVPGHGGADAIEQAAVLLTWMTTRVGEELVRLKRDSDAYNAQLEHDLPQCERFGWFRREELWAVAPDADFLIRDELSEAQRAGFTALAPGLESSAAIQDLTLTDFLRFCATCYDGAGYAESADASPLEKYRQHADGRHDGLLDIDPDSPMALAEWMRQGSRGGHPFEIARGGNTTHISLYLHLAEDGTHLILAGSSPGRSAETVRMALALHAAGVPFELRDHQLHRGRVQGTDALAIVPEACLGAYDVPDLFPEEVAVHDQCSHETLAEFPGLLPSVRWLPLERLGC